MQAFQCCTDVTLCVVYSLQSVGDFWLKSALHIHNITIIIINALKTEKPKLIYYGHLSLYNFLTLPAWLN